MGDRRDGRNSLCEAVETGSDKAWDGNHPVSAYLTCGSRNRGTDRENLSWEI